MSVAVGLLDFYILEASEYVDQLDAVVGAAVNAPPESGPFITAARALRGSSTMAKLLRLAELAGSVERVGRGLRTGSIQWTTELRGVVVSAVDDIRVLLRAVRNWGPAEDQRATARVAELARFLPEGVQPPGAPVGGAVSAGYFASEVEGVAAALQAFLAAPADRPALDEALGRVRALRGISALKELPPLADVADAIEFAAKSGTGDGRSLTPHHAAVFESASHVLRRAARELRTVGRPDASTPEVRHFAEAASALQTKARNEEQVVPVAKLFFPDDGPHVVSRSDRPQTAFDTRFHAEVVAHAEHVRRLVADAMSAMGPDGTVVGRNRAEQDLRSALRTIRGIIDSFGYTEPARFFGAAAAEAKVLDSVTLASIDAGAALLASRTLGPTDLTARLADLARGRTVDSAIGTGLGPIEQPRRVASAAAALGTAPPRSTVPATPSASHAVRPTPARVERVGRRTPLTPTGPELRQFLETGIAGFHELDETPLAPPAPLDEATLVPINDLVYRGRAALERAIELRNAMRSSGEVDADTLAEMFDLLDLAAVE